MKTLLLTSLTALLLAVPAFPQAPGVPIEEAGKAGQADILKKAKALQDAGKLKLSIELAKAQLKEPVPGPISAPAPNTHPLSGREVAARARQAHLQFGWYYKCPRCDKMHINLAGAYAVAEDALATCHHCVEPKAGEMVEGWLIAVDHKGDVLPVTQILAKSSTLDAAVLRVDGKLSPLPLNDNVAPGDPAFCYSSPLGHAGYFSEGIVNRFHMIGAKQKPGTVGEWKNLRVNVSTDWAPGSSGAAVLDQCGNAIGHVSTIHPLSEGPRPIAAPKVEEKKDEAKPEEKKKAPAPRVDRFGGAVLITLHDATPARGVMALIREASAAKPGVPDAPVAAAKIPPPDTSEPGSLKVGADAPKLAFSKWAQGAEVKEFARDKAYLVEFWATWCGPCKVTIPHLNALHKKYAEKGLVVIGANVWEPDTDNVAPFLKEMGDKMSYSIALDTVDGDPGSGLMAVTWMTAAGQKGIPAAFLVDKAGKLAWVGHPSQLKDAIIEDVLAGKFDVEKAKLAAVEDGKFAEVMEKFSVRVRQAITGKKWDALAKLADELDKDLPESRKLYADDLRFRAAANSKRTADAVKIAEKILADKTADGEALNNVSWALLITPGLENVDFAFCEKVARRALELAPEDNRSHIIDTLARAVWLQGRKDEAIKLQEEAVSKATNALKRASIEATLEAYKKGELPKGVDEAVVEDS